LDFLVLQRGDRVLVLTRFSAWAEQIIVKKDFVFKIPKEMSFREAAVLPISYLTAYILLFEIGNIKSGQTLLFHSAGGGVGGKFISIFIYSNKIFYSCFNTII
jgi:NADPH:quinone reductase-like Zn-dependent oxidoreductase